MSRRASMLAVAVLVLTAAGCKKGVLIDLPAGGGTGNSVSLVKNTADPINQGEAVQFTATVTKDGSPQQGVTVTFSIAPTTAQPTVNFSPPSGSTSAQGALLTTVNTTTATPTSLTVTATDSGGASASVGFSLSAAP